MMMMSACTAGRTRLASESGKPESRALVDSISDVNVKSHVEEKLRELDTKNDTIHVCIYAFAYHHVRVTLAEDMWMKGVHVVWATIVL